ncbi:transcriptional activator RfaH [Rosistilla carotiformis]|uniref:Transcriptional activator RfaH n=1 Tax=Rosistilla carotiformis TaxID=2528017 RepID=A0A518JSN5_9BACT|nr:KOW motif-containing protein [Rosistilla carotiformis]QDV68547.1 transcriptional activator RfaH [Rosistilla carotiformis]
MPILGEEPDIFPETVLELPDEPDTQWWALYTRSRQEKQLMRKLRELEIGHYSPVISRRYKSPAGRVRTTHLPLFANYVFVRGTGEARYEAVSTGCVSRCIEIADPTQLVTDLRQIRNLIDTGAALAPEERLVPGDLVRVKSGPFAGFEGTVVQRDGQRRLIVAVRFMNQGASAALDDCQLDFLGKSAPQ